MEKNNNQKKKCWIRRVRLQRFTLNKPPESESMEYNENHYESHFDNTVVMEFRLIPDTKLLRSFK